MQRIIKFRGKRVDNGEWVYGSLAFFFNSPKNAMIMPNCYFGTSDMGEQDPSGNPVISDEIALGGFIPVDPATVGQFTGLTDKNGKEIYEGDVLSKEPFLKVTFENGGFCFSNDLLSGSDRLSQERVGRLSIISNIYENPELCKG